MVDAIGTTDYTYDAVGQLLTEGGVFTSDTVSNTYTNRARAALSLQQPTGSWTNGFGWDSTGRLTNVTSRAGAFGYSYAALDANFSGRLVQRLALPSGAYVTNFYDPVARVLGTVLKSSGGSTLDSALYGYNQGNQRTAYTNAAGAYVHYTNDSIGQLKAGTSSTPSENRGYAYDAAWNLNYLTNNGSTTAYSVDGQNQLTSVGGMPCLYDASGNLVRVGSPASGMYLTYTYDDENRLTEVTTNYQAIQVPVGGIPAVLVSNPWNSDFVYDGLGRLRKRLEYVNGTLQTTTLYLYDGWRVIQERDANDNPTVSYTRGSDLSGSLEGAGGIGGLLARSSGYSSGNWTSHAYYHADGNGNITCLVDTNQAVVASYRYDAFGNMVSQSGTLADANIYRFSCKEIHTNSLMYYYGYRFCDPNLQRWLSSDPVDELGFRKGLRSRVTAELAPNAYLFVRNGAINQIDALGLAPCKNLLDDVKTLKGLIDAVRQAAKDAESGKIPKDPCKVPSSLNAICTCLYDAAKAGDVEQMILCICQCDPDPDCDRQARKIINSPTLTPAKSMPAAY
jgi:RHS repeat-associated protein